MHTPIIQDYNQLLKAVNVPKATAEKALALSIETALRHYYKILDCRVDMETVSANMVFMMPRHRHIIETIAHNPDVLENDIFPVTIELTALPRAVRKIVRPLFIETLKRMKTEDDFSVWKKRTRNIIRGVIVKRHADHIEVDLNGQIGILEKPAWVGSEEKYYYVGNILFFYVSSIKRRQNSVKIYLSSSSVKLPALLLKAHLPAHHFVCIRRFIGHKSIIFTNAGVRDAYIRQIRDIVSKELNGEILEMRSLPIGRS